MLDEDYHPLKVVEMKIPNYKDARALIVSLKHYFSVNVDDSDLPWSVLTHDKKLGARISENTNTAILVDYEDAQGKEFIFVIGTDPLKGIDEMIDRIHRFLADIPDTNESEYTLSNIEPNKELDEYLCPKCGYTEQES